MKRVRWSVALGLTGIAVALAGLAAGDSHAEGPTFVLRNGEVGMIVSSIAYGLGPDADQSGACPQGMSKSFVDAYKATHQDGEPRAGESERDYQRRINRISSTAPSGENLCVNPNASSDPSFRTITGRHAPTSGGLNLDGQVSRLNGSVAQGTCEHDDFRGQDGSRGIDNQFYRVVGCTQSFQSRGQENTFETEMFTGSWAILVDLKGVDDLQNDPDVTVGIHASADPIQVSAARVPLPYGTYVADSDPRFRATTHGRIVNGVLTTDPVDVRFHWYVNGMRLERPLQDARVRLTFTAGASGPQVEGYLSGYTPIQELYDNNFGYGAGRDLQGNPSSPQRILGTAVGAANVMGYTCNGMYHALMENADGHRDPSTGRCSSISTQYRVRAIPAFVVNG